MNPVEEAIRQAQVALNSFTPEQLDQMRSCMQEIDAGEFTQIAQELHVVQVNHLVPEDTSTWMQTVLDNGLEAFQALPLHVQTLFCCCVDQARQVLNEAVLHSMGLGFLADQPDLDVHVILVD